MKNENMKNETIINADSVVLSTADELIIIDQTLLPNEEKRIILHTAEQIFEAIYSLRVRGAPAIGICAGFGMYVLAKQIGDDFLENFKKCADYLNSSRPTAVNLKHATDRMLFAAEKNIDKSRDELLKTLRCESENIRLEDIEMCRKISDYGLTLVKDGDGILTHCNAGPLATSRYGTGLGTLFLGNEKGYKFHVFTDETRPLLQGARLTAYELQKAGIDVTLICDNMASIVMKQGKINACFVGCDRVAANGDTANKIGTSGVAILARHYNIPFYVFCPSSTIDFTCKTGDDIVIEERESEEIKTKFFEKPVALDEVKCYNPAFDVTDNTLITAIITEKGICRPPYTQSINKLFRGENKQ